tara:strand:+ start:2821 stop:3126 length:306 start_codon:yes stop_codon:yes gene_type:complete
MPSIGSSALTPELQFSPRQVEWAEQIGGMYMLRLWILGAVVTLAGCESTTTPEGCPVMMTELGQRTTQACIAEFYAEKARIEGKGVTTCRSVGNTIACVDG